jgi:hypothetical protein
MQHDSTIPQNKLKAALQRKTFNLLVSGHTAERLKGNMDSVCNVLNAALNAVHKKLSDPTLPDRTLRIWTGLSDGSDQCAANWAQDHDVVLLRVAATSSAEHCANADSLTGVIAVAESGSEDGRAPLWTQATDEFKLAMASLPRLCAVVSLCSGLIWKDVTASLRHLMPASHPRHGLSWQTHWCQIPSYPCLKMPRAMFRVSRGCW